MGGVLVLFLVPSEPSQLLAVDELWTSLTVCLSELLNCQPALVIPTQTQRACLFSGLDVCFRTVVCSRNAHNALTTVWSKHGQQAEGWRYTIAL